MPIDFFERIKKNKSPYIIAEVGSNHNGDMDLARKLVDAAKKCGCDAVKFQSWTPQSLIAREEYERNTKYTDSPKKHFGSLKEMVEKYYLREEQHFELKKYCSSVCIDFCSSPFSELEIDLLVKLDVPFIKIASMDVNNLTLLKYAANTNKPIVLSTGMASLDEIKSAVKTIESQGNYKIILLHCISIYPPEFVDINLNNILMLRQTFNYPVGFSDHTIGTSIPLAATTLGSCIIEKHFTIDKDLPGWDHQISADPLEMKTIVNESKNIVKALGMYERVVLKEEEEKKLKFRRSIVAKHNLTAGHIITTNDLVFKRPGTGIPPDEINKIVGKKIKRNIKEDELIHRKDLDI
ncbi:MAG: N-acetylneuraminate synthase family protein [Bacteroidetes bacterium]|nr:N-acetylneuraminate synthase family protein [Bacteroidota bacterium]